MINTTSRSDTLLLFVYPLEPNMSVFFMLLCRLTEFQITSHPFQLDPDAPKEGIDKREYYRRKFGSQSERMEARMSQVYIC